MKVDYIIVGCGLAGIAFCEQLRKHNKSFLVVEDNSQTASKVAGGLYNPVNLKRFTLAWKADFLMSYVKPYYKSLETYLDISIDQDLEVLRAFASIEEQNNWFAASDKPLLSQFMDTEVIKNDHASVIANHGFGKVLQTGKINTQHLINSYIQKLNANKALLNESFKYENLLITIDTIQYNSITTKHIVFSEGFGITKNPFFNDLPLVGNKGEYLIVKAPDLKIDFALKGSIFVIPLLDNQYLVGATYDREDKTNLPTHIKREELIEKLKKLISCSVSIVNQTAGIRPTVKDRKPLVGTHVQHNNMHVLNGLGTRGVMASPYLAEQLYNAIENNTELDPEIDIKRYTT